MTGWSWEYIDNEMTIPRSLALANHWKSWPPLHQAVAIFIGVGDRQKKSEIDEHGLTLFDIAPRTPGK